MIEELKKQVRFLFLLSLENAREVQQLARKCGVGKYNKGHLFLSKCPLGYSGGHNNLNKYLCPPLYFDEILGGPTPKVENLKHVLRKHRLKPSEVIYIGDAHSDVIASRKVKVKAILLGRKHLYEKLKEDLEADFRFSSLCAMPFDVSRL